MLVAEVKTDAVDTGAAGQPRPGAAPLLQVCGLTKKYGNNIALNNADLAFYPGRVHVLFGENGSGKSTFISMVAGANQPTSGYLVIDDHKGPFRSVNEARSFGVRAVFQEFSLVPQLTVAQNLVLGEEPVGSFGLLSSEEARRRAQALIDDMGFDLSPDATVGELTRGKQQMVEIGKALQHVPRLLILDEPTASLSEHDARALFKLVKRLKEKGVAIIYITHRMHEIAELGDEVSILRDGRLIGTVPASTGHDDLIELMTGRALSEIYPPLNEQLGDVKLAIKGLSLAPAPGVPTVSGIDLEVRAGEIVGIAGLVGCGKSELGQACFGLRRITKGEILVDGKLLRASHPADAIKAGVWYSPADRKNDGLALGRPAGENMSLSGLTWGEIAGQLLKPRKEKSLLGKLSGSVAFPVPRLGESAGSFSGGNQQKVLLAKGLAQDATVYIFDEPTVGVDMGARPAIYRYMADLLKAGAAILLISSDLSELFGLSHRLLVMNEGRINSEFSRDEFDEHHVLDKFF